MKQRTPVVLAVLGLFIGACAGSDDGSAGDATTTAGPTTTIDLADGALSRNDATNDSVDGPEPSATSEPLPTSTVGATVAPIQTDTAAGSGTTGGATTGGTTGSATTGGTTGGATTGGTTGDTTGSATTGGTTGGATTGGATTGGTTTGGGTTGGAVPTAPLEAGRALITIGGVDFAFQADICEVEGDLFVASGIGVTPDGDEFVAGVAYDFFGGTQENPEELFFELIVEVEPPSPDALDEAPQYYADKVIEPDFTTGEEITVQFSGSRLAGFGPITDFSGVTAPVGTSLPMTFAAQC